MAGSMYNQGVNLFARDGVTPTLSKITAKTKAASHATFAYGTQLRRLSKGFGGSRGMFGSILGRISIVSSLYGIAQGIKGVISETGRFEVANLQFTKLIGNVELAQKTLKDMELFAAKTPFEFKQAQGLAKSLLAARVPAGKLIETLRMIGDVAMGDPEKVERLTLAYSKVRTTGKANWRELQMFATAGVPIFEELRHQLNLDQEGLESFVRTGKVKFPDLEKAIKGLTTGAGTFKGMMFTMMATLPGLWSNFLDVVGMVQRALGATFQDSLKQVNIQLTALGLRTMEWVKANKMLLQSGIGGFFNHIAWLLKNTDASTLMNGLMSMLRWIPRIAKAVVFFKMFKTALFALGVGFQVAGVLGTISGGAIAMAWAPFSATMIAIVATLIIMWGLMNKIRGRKFFGGARLGMQELGLTGQNFKAVYGYDMPELPTLKTDSDTGTPTGIQNNVSLNRIEHSTSQNLSQSVTWSVPDNAVVDLEGDVLPGFDMAKLNNASILS